MTVAAALFDPGAYAGPRDLYRGAAALAVAAVLLHLAQAFTPLALAGLWLLVWIGLIYPAVCLFANRARAVGRSVWLGVATAFVLFTVHLLLSAFFVPAFLTGANPELFDPGRLARAALIPNILISAALFAAAAYWTRFWARA